MDVSSLPALRMSDEEELTLRQEFELSQREQEEAPALVETPTRRDAEPLTEDGHSPIRATQLFRELDTDSPGAPDEGTRAVEVHVSPPPAVAAAWAHVCAPPPALAAMAAPSFEA